MDRELILKLLGKKDSVDLYDSIYNLRDIGDKLRKIIILSDSVKDDSLIECKKELEKIHNIIKPILDKIKDDNYIKGYTNSKNYLLKYIDVICQSVVGIINGINSNDVKVMTYNINILMDKVLIY